MSLQEFLQHVETKGNQLVDWQTVIQIGYVEHPDSLIAAALFGRVFYELEHPFVLFKIDDNTTIEERLEFNCILIGISLAKVKNLQFKEDHIILIEPQKTVVDEPAVINPGEYGYLRPEVSLTSVAYLMCDPIANSIQEIIQFPLIASQTIDMMSEYKGINDMIAQHGLSEGLIELKKDLAFLGADIFSLHETLVYSQIPFLPGLSGNERQVTQLLVKAGIVTETNEGTRKLADLQEDEIKTLNSSLVVFLSEYKGHQEDELVFIRPKTYLQTKYENTILHNTWDYGQAIIDAINRKKIGLALAVLLGNRSDKFRELNKLFKEERRALAASFELLVDKKEEVIELKNLRYIKTDQKISWYNTSVAAAMGLSSGLVTIDHPFAVVAPGPDNKQTIGIRASKQHIVGAGINSLIAEILEERNLDGNIEGSRLDVLVSISKDEVENVILDLNSKLGALKE